MKKLLLFVFIIVSILKGELKEDDIFKIDTANIYKQTNNNVKALKILNNVSKENMDSKFKLLKEECDKNNNAAACAFYGEYLFKKKGNKQLGKKYIKKSCDLKNEAGCVLLIQIREKYENNFNNNNLLDKLCRIGKQPNLAGYGCFYLGKNYLTNGKIKEGLNYLKRGCFLKNKQSCFVLGILYSKGMASLQKNEEKAKKYFMKACNLGYEEACIEEIKIYSKKNQIKQNEEKISKISKILCDKFNNAAACYYYGIYSFKEKSKTKKINKNKSMVIIKTETLNYLDKSCKLGYQRACYFLNELLKDKK